MVLLARSVMTVRDQKGLAHRPFGIFRGLSPEKDSRPVGIESGAGHLPTRVFSGEPKSCIT